MQGCHVVDISTFETVQTGSHETKRLVKVGLVVVVLVGTSQLNAAGEEVPHMLGRSHDVGSLVGNVVLHARLGVDGELRSLVNGAAKAPVVLAGIDIVGVVLGVINVVFGTIAAEALGGDFEFAGAVAKGQEAEDAEQETDGLCRDRLDGTDVDGLGIVTEPVAKVDTGHHELAKLFAVEGSGHGQGEQGIFDIAVSP